MQYEKLFAAMYLSETTWTRIARNRCDWKCHEEGFT